MAIPTNIEEAIMQVTHAITGKMRAHAALYRGESGLRGQDELETDMKQCEEDVRRLRTVRETLEQINSGSPL